MNMNTYNVFMEIRVPAGANGLWMDAFDAEHAHEQELLLARGAKFKVIAAERQEDLIYLRMELLP
jgi:hypothetical protein